jgi:hypothetical protein
MAVSRGLWSEVRVVADELRFVVARARRPAGLGAIVVMLAVAAWGCSRAGPPVVYVEGVVLLDGKPVEGATVGFSPGDRGLPAVGCTDEEGRFELTSTGGGRPAAGAAVGDYGVVISKQVVEGAVQEVPAQESDRPPEKWQGADPSRPPLPPRVVYLIPQAYGDVATSGLAVDVKPGSNAFRFELDSQFKASETR